MTVEYTVLTQMLFGWHCYNRKDRQWHFSLSDSSCSQTYHHSMTFPPRTLGLNTSLCNWILDFLTGRPQVVRVGNNTSATLILNTGAPHETEQIWQGSLDPQSCSIESILTVCITAWYGNCSASDPLLTVYYQPYQHVQITSTNLYPQELTRYRYPLYIVSLLSFYSFTFLLF